MSYAGKYFKGAISVLTALDEGKPHSSITDWVEVLSSDRYDELSLDGIPELVESINIQGYQGTTEAARAIRKKLKYGNVHRQLRALIILRALTENAGKGFKLGWANAELLGRLKEMANDSLLDPKVNRRLILVFHAWSIHYQDEPRMQSVASLYRQYGGAGPALRKATAPAVTSSTSSRSSTTASRSSTGGFSDQDEIFSHNWTPAPGQRGPYTYAHLASAKQDAEERKRQREARIAMEQREAEIERREREMKRTQDMQALELRRQKEAEEERERRRKAKEDLKNKPAQAKRPKFDFQKEKPQVMVAVANAIQCANNLVNSCRHLNREIENVRESPKVQDNLDKAKAARRSVIRYIQLVSDEEFVGTLLDANEKIVEAIQLYDKLSKPAVLDSDSDSESGAPHSSNPRQVENLTKRMAAQKLEADRTGELQRMQERQKMESARRQQYERSRKPSRQGSSGAHPDLQDLDFGSISKTRGGGQGLQPPMNPDSDRDSYGVGSLSEYSDDDYNSCDEEWRAARSRRHPAHYPAQKSGAAQNQARHYATLDEDGQQGKKGLLDPNDPFGDPFGDEGDTPMQERPRMQWAEV